ncbi:hypothetical protein ABW636_05870 [Aquimarina sp. 2201CG1-2-11]|uniref:hypothetical protein n=1 Tax=Aquimarina discodermiae TaxID=3231043 RepID=UPI0034637DAB
MKIIKPGIFWTILIGILGFVITIYFTIFYSRDREPVYVSKYAPSAIFNKNISTENIKVITSDSSVINDNIYVTNLILWNRGELEIKKSDVRKDFLIKMNGGGKILDHKIVKQNDANVSNFRIIEKEEGLLIDWDYFDPKFGLEIQVIYSGNKSSKLIIDGYVLGNMVEEIDSNYALNDIDKNKNQILIIAILGLTAMFLLGYIIYRQQETNKLLWNKNIELRIENGELSSDDASELDDIKKQNYSNFNFYIILTLSVILIGSVFYYHNYMNTPPF